MDDLLVSDRFPRASAYSPEWVTASASGLDPHVSVAAARFQIDRVAAARDLAPAAVARLVDDHAEGPWLSWFGEPRVNVLRLNLALDALRR